jgi:hypothetical protein
MIRALLLAALALLAAAAAPAHETTRSYLTLARDGAEVTGRLRVAFRDLEAAVWLDADLDGAITWAETAARLPAVAAYVAGGLAVEAGGDCPLRLAGAGVSRAGGLDYLDLDLAATCPAAAAPARLSARLFADLDPEHRILVTALAAGGPATAILGPATGALDLAAGGGRAASLAAFARAGAAHLAGGADHLLFLLVLVLPALAAAGSARRALPAVALAATGFTLAHALSLSAVTLGSLRPRSDLVELAVALTIALTAADNLRPFLPGSRTLVATAFGLIHGFGVATAVGGLPVRGADLAVALLGFNLGIEAAQLAALAVTLPALAALRAGGLLLRAGSAAAFAVAAVWVVQRAAAL